MNNMTDAIKNFFDCGFLFVRGLDRITERLSISLISGSCAEVFRLKNEANQMSASNLTWVIGDGLYLRTNAVSSVNNPSPLTHENY